MLGGVALELVVCGVTDADGELLVSLVSVVGGLVGVLAVSLDCAVVVKYNVNTIFKIICTIADFFVFLTN